MSRQESSTPAGSGRSIGSFLLGLFLGMVLGLVIAAAVAWYIKGTPVPFQSREEEPRATVGERTIELPAKPGDAANPKPRYDFNNILPGPDDAPKTSAVAPAPAAAPVVTTPGAPVTQAVPVPVDNKDKGNPNARTGPMFLQAGAFSSEQDADNLKARLALMGQDAQVQTVNTADKGTLYRVRTGPYNSAAELDKARAALTEAGVQVSISR